MSFLWFIIIGIVAGYVAGKIMRGGGFGLIVNLVVGIIGGVLGGWLFSLLGIYSTGGIIGSLVVATIGAIVLRWIIFLSVFGKIVFVRSSFLLYPIGDVRCNRLDTLLKMAVCVFIL